MPHSNNVHIKLEYNFLDKISFICGAKIEECLGFLLLDVVLRTFGLSPSEIMRCLH